MITEATDRQALELMVKSSDENLSEPVKEIAADSGYSSYDNYEYLIKKDKIGYIPDQDFRKEKNKNPYYQDNFKYNQKNVERMREWLKINEGRKRNIQQMWTTKPIFGHLKFNLGYKQFLLRTLEKVKGEFRLMRIGFNLKKMHKIMGVSWINLLTNSGFQCFFFNVSI